MASSKARLVASLLPLNDHAMSQRHSLTVGRGGAFFDIQWAALSDLIVDRLFGL